MKLCTTTAALGNAFGIEKALEIIASNGFDGLDFSFFDYPENEGVFALSDAEFDAYWEGIRKKCDSLGLFVNQTHAHMISYVNDQSRKEYVFEKLLRSVRATAILDGKIVVIHPAIMSDCIYHWKREENFAHNMEFFGSFIPYLKEYDLHLGVENMFSFDPIARHYCATVCSEAEDMCRYIDTLGERFVACLDVGHTVFCGQPIERTVKTLGDRLRALHVHDNDGIEDRHTLPYYGGKINYDELCAALKSIHYKGNFSFEADGFMWDLPDALKPAASKFMESTGRYLISLASWEQEEKN